MSQPEELTRLLARCALNDRRAFERLYQLTSAQLFGLVLRIVKHRETAGEVLQEGYVKIWNRAADFRPEKSKPMTWMSAIVRHQAIDWLRRSTHQIQDPEPIEEIHWLADDKAGPQETASRAYQNQALYDCLQQLPKNQRQAMLLAYFEGLTHEQLATRLQTPLGTVKSWLRRGLLRLKQCLSEYN